MNGQLENEYIYSCTPRGDFIEIDTIQDFFSSVSRKSTSTLNESMTMSFPHAKRF